MAIQGHSAEGFQNESLDIQLIFLGRERYAIDCPPGKCLFQSIASQIADTDVNYLHLSNIFQKAAKRSPDRWIPYTYAEENEKVEESFYRQLKEMTQDEWNTGIQDLVPNVLSRELGVRIIILKDNQIPTYIPDEDKSPIMNTDIVVAYLSSDKDRNNYQPTQLIAIKSPIQLQSLSPKNGSPSRNDCEYSITLPRGSVCQVKKGDITKLTCDAIVNAANTKLRHGAGLAGAIVKAGGNSIQTECEGYIAKHGELLVGQAMSTYGAKLPCKRVIHAVGPRWKGGKELEEESLLKCIGSIFDEAEKLELKSIAIPPISTGIFGYPLDQAVRTIINAVAVRESERKYIPRSVIFIDIKSDSLKLFQSELQSKFGSMPTISDKVHAFKDADGQLLDMGRKRVLSPPDGNCLFHSVTMQLKVPGMDHRKLRALACDLIEKNIDHYLIFSTTGTKKSLLAEIEHLRQDKIYATDTADFFLPAINEHFKKRIISIRDFEQPQYLGEQAHRITDDDIILVHGNNMNHYDSSEPIRKKSIEMKTAPQSLASQQSVRKSSLTKSAHQKSVLQPSNTLPMKDEMHGTAEDQVEQLMRTIQLMPNDRDSFFAAIASQMNNEHYTVKNLRKLLVSTCKSKPKIIRSYCKNDEEMILLLNTIAYEAEKMLEWEDEYEYVSMILFEKALEKNIIIVEDNTRPLMVNGSNPSPVTPDSIVLVRHVGDSNNLYYDSTHPLKGAGDTSRRSPFQLPKLSGDSMQTAVESINVDEHQDMEATRPISARPTTLPLPDSGGSKRKLSSPCSPVKKAKPSD